MHSVWFHKFCLTKKIMGNVNQKVMSIFGPFLAIFWLVWVNFMICTCSWIPNLVMRVKKNFLHSVNFHYEIELKTVFKIAANTIDKNWTCINVFCRFNLHLQYMFNQILHLFSRRATISTFLTSVCLIFCRSGSNHNNSAKNQANKGQKSQNRSYPAEKMRNLIKHVL